MIPAAYAVRSALLLKLLGKSRRSHVMDLVLDQGVALAAGLNAIPKATFMWQYSSRLGRKAIARLLGKWIDMLRDQKLIDTGSFNLDFHSISYFGDDPFVEKHYVPRRSQRRKAVLTFFAQDAEGQVFFYSNADLRKGEEADEVLRFVKFWEKKYGQRPRHLVFDRASAPRSQSNPHRRWTDRVCDQDPVVEGMDGRDRVRTPPRAGSPPAARPLWAIASGGSASLRRSKAARVAEPGSGRRSARARRRFR